MLLDFSQLVPRDAYAWMTATLLPRPIAWVSTLSADGRTNLAPFSFFTGVTSNPPTLMFVPVNDRHGQPKDTLRNIRETGEFVVNTVPEALTATMNATAALLPHGESEFDRFGITPAASDRVKPPRVAAAPIAFECTLHQIVTVGEGALAGNIVIGRILLAQISDAVLGADGKVDNAKLGLVGRMGGEAYCRTLDTFEIKRPDRK